MRDVATRVLCAAALFAASLAPLATHALPPRPPNPNELLLRARTLVPVASRASAAAKQGRHLLIQFEASRQKEALAGLRARNIRVLEAVPRNAVSAWVPAGVDPLAAPGVRWAGRLAPADKVSLPAESFARELRVLVDVFPDVAKPAALAAVRRAGGREIPNSYLRATTLHIEIAARALGALAAQDEISFIYAPSAAIEQNLPVASCLGALTQNGAVPNYAIGADGWDGPGLGSAALQYFFENGTPDLVNEESEVTRALATWSSVAQITWSPTGFGRQPRAIDFLWATGDHGDGSSFDGPGQVIAHALLPAPPNAEPEAGDVHFDDAEDWRSGGADVDVYTVALHEIGHALGLAHSSDPSAVMYAHYSGPVGGLASDDIAAIRSIYAQVGPSPGDVYEPDDTLALARALPSPETHSITPAHDIDFRTFTLASHADVTIAALPSSAGDDTLLTLYDGQGGVIEVNDDFGGTKHSTIERTRAGGDPLPAGTYFVSIEEAGQDAEIGSYGVSLATESYPGPDSFEPDDSAQQAVATTPSPQSRAQTLSPAGDKDYSVFSLGELSEVSIQAIGVFGSANEVELWLLASDGSALEHSSVIPGTSVARIDRTRANGNWLQPGTYYAVVGEKGDDAEIAYTLKLEAFSVPYGGDDTYEENDSLETALDLTGVQWWLQYFSAFQLDDDYYRILVPRTQRHLTVNCGASVPIEKLDFKLLDAAGNVVLSTVGRPSDRMSPILASSGTYYIHVFGLNTGTAYGCSWQTENERPLIPPVNDDFAHAIHISLMHESAYGDNIRATTEPGEPAHAGEVGGHSVWFTWTAPSTGDFSVSTWDPLDTLLAVYRGSSVDALSLVAENDNARGALTSHVEFGANANESFAIAVDGHGGAQGYFSVLVLPVLAPPPPEPPPPPPPPPVPPVQASWSSFKSKCKASTGACKVKAKLLVQNPGAGPSTLQINYLLSDDTDPHDAEDTLVQVVRVPSLAAGAAITLKLKTTLAGAHAPRGKYLIAVAVSDGGTLSAPFGPLR